MISLSKVTETLFFIEHILVAAYVRCLKEKNERNEIVCFYCTQSDILFCRIARFSQGNKNKLRTYQPQKWKKLRTASLKQNFTGSYKKRVYYNWGSSKSVLQSILRTNYSKNISRWLLLKRCNSCSLSINTVLK